VNGRVVGIAERERVMLTDTVIDRVNGRVVGIAERERVMLTDTVIDRVNGRVVGMAERERVRLTDTVTDRVNGRVVAMAVREKVTVADGVIQDIVGVTVVDRVNCKVGAAVCVTDSVWLRLDVVVAAKEVVEDMVNNCAKIWNDHVGVRLVVGVFVIMAEVGAAEDVIVRIVVGV